MKPRLVSLLIWSFLPGAALGQGGWVSTPNTGFVQPPVAGSVTPSISGTHPDRTDIGRGANVVLPLDSPPAARLGSAEHRQPREGSHPVAITTPVPDVLTYPAHTRFARGIHPYVYTPYFYIPSFPGRVVQSIPTPRTETGTTDGLFIGMPRADVIETLGRPSATIYRDSGQETLFFNNATILIQNGFVAVIQ